jgi:ferredoxin-NADP reductase
MKQRTPRRRVLASTWAAPGTLRLRLERGDTGFLPGQYFALGLPGADAFREYSVHSGSGDPWLEFLIRVVGPVSRALARLKPGDGVEAEGPFGAFTLDEAELTDARCPDARAPLLLAATGVGIAPLHSFVKSHPDLDYLALHGVRCAAEIYDRADFATERHIACLSGPGEAAATEPGIHAGRLTDWLRAGGPELAGRWGLDWADRALCLLAGNADMVHEAWAILAGAGVAPDRIRTETFF